MINKNVEKRLNELKETSPDTYNMFKDILDTYEDELSISSHEIKNILSFLNSSCQIIESHHKEIQDFEFWTEIKQGIYALIKYMERTTLYRYSTHINPEKFCINNLLYAIPDKFDSLFPENSCLFSFNTCKEAIYINADSENISTAILEILKNIYEYQPDNYNINIYMQPDNRKYARLDIAGYSTDNPFPIDYDSADDVTDMLCKPFYTTHNHHAGLGLSIAYNIFTKCNCDFKILSDKNNNVAAVITFPIADKT